MLSLAQNTFHHNPRLRGPVSSTYKRRRGNNLPKLKLQQHQPKTKFEPVHEISNNVVCATSKASDQPAHTRSLIRGFASRLSIL